MKTPGLSIFSRFKTGRMQLTGEAKRQRGIISILAERANPADRTRTGIAQHMADAEGTLWKNIYSGIFRDLDEVLVPMGIASEEGRLPLKRGPKALQEVGIPYYRLTRQGMLVALALSQDAGQRARLLGLLFDGTEDPAEKRFRDTLGALSESSPLLFGHIMALYVGAFCRKEIDSLLPFDPAQLQKVRDPALLILREYEAACASLTGPERAGAAELLGEMAGPGKGAEGSGDSDGDADGRSEAPDSGQEGVDGPHTAASAPVDKKLSDGDE